jgi:hypothetical protein
MSAVLTIASEVLQRKRGFLFSGCSARHRAAFVSLFSMHALKPNTMLAMAVEPTRVQQQIGHVLSVPLKRTANPRRRTIIMEERPARADRPRTAPREPFCGALMFRPYPRRYGVVYSTIALT